MKLRNIFVLALALCMVFTLCACGGNNGDNKETTAPTAAPTTAPTTAPTVDDGKVTYTVKVVDEGGNAISGAMVQLCLDACVPAITDANGVATYKLAEANYKVSFVTMRQGSTADAAEFYFASGSRELTITLKAVS
jgi:hypothetical protein